MNEQSLLASRLSFSFLSFGFTLTITRCVFGRGALLNIVPSLFGVSPPSRCSLLFYNARTTSGPSLLLYYVRTKQPRPLSYPQRYLSHVETTPGCTSSTAEQCLSHHSNRCMGTNCVTYLQNHIGRDVLTLSVLRTSYNRMI